MKFSFFGKRTNTLSLMKGKVCIVTGANAGLGFETAKGLAQKGAEVGMICRSEARGREAREAIIRDTGNQRVHLFLADLSKQDDVRRMAAAIRRAFGKVDVLVNNAAVVASERTLTADGIEMQFAVNHLAGFLLTHCLMEGLLASGSARIVNISSGNHRRGRIHFEDISLEAGYHVLKAYNQSKLANVLFTYELERRLKRNGIQHITANCVDPGTNFTDIGTKATGRWHALAWKIRRLVSMSPEQGAQCQIHLASSEEVEGISGKFWYKSKPLPSARQSYDEAAARALWELSQKCCDMDDFFRIR